MATMTTQQPTRLGLSEDAVQRVLPELDKHVSSLFVWYHQLRKHHWLVQGPQFRDLHLFFEEAYKTVHKAFDALAERMTALGGTPTSGPTAQAKLSYLTHEEEGEKPVREMLELDLQQGLETARRMRQTIQVTREVGDPGTEHLLLGYLLEIEDTVHHIEHYLADDSLEEGRSS